MVYAMRHERAGGIQESMHVVSQRFHCPAAVGLMDLRGATMSVPKRCAYRSRATDHVGTRQRVPGVTALQYLAIGGKTRLESRDQ